MQNKCSAIHRGFIVIFIIVLTSILLDYWTYESFSEEPANEKRKTSHLPAKISNVDLKSCTAKPNIEFYGQTKHDKLVHHELFSNPDRCGGTIVEIGALDGKRFSNSWYFEQALNWEPILIEAKPANAKELVINRPNAITVPKAICPPGNEGKTMAFHDSRGALGGLEETMAQQLIDYFHLENDQIVQVPCTTLSTIFLQYNITRIDAFFLDVEGGEYEVIKTMNWNIPVLVWIIELNGFNLEKDRNITSILKENGYCERDDWNKEMFCTHCESDSFFMQC